MIKLTSPHYWEDSAILRATQAWTKEKKVEDAVSQNYQLYLEQVKRELSDLHAQYSVEGLLNYSDLLRKLNPAQLAQYKNMVQQVINQNRNIEDEELRLELEKLTQYNDLTILDSKMNILEAYSILLVTKNLETVSESLSEAYQETYYHNLYDIHRKKGEVTPFEKATEDKTNEILLVAWTGMNFRDAIKHSRHNLNKNVRLTVIQSLIRKEPFNRTFKSLSKLISSGKGYKVIRTILRGETTRIIAEASRQSYEQSGIEQYQFLATLDNRTTQICIHMDKRVFNVKDMEIGVNAPNMHYNCRSTIMPYFPEDDLSESQRRARDSETNQNYKVNGNISYQEWDKKYNQ